jgi:UDP-2,3-diacylglucosamine pyrophosphatase LpxH
MDNFEQAVIHEARRRGADGLVCGHIHHATLSALDDIAYGNAGDWVESCTALVEHLDGRLEVIHWLDEMAQRTTEEEPHAADARIGRLATAG